MKVVDRVLALVVLACVGFVVGLAGAFFHDAWLDVAGLAVPLGLLLAFVAEAAALVLAGFALRNRLAVLAPAVGWLIPVFAMSIQRGEGDLVLGSTGPGYVLLLGGAVVIGLCVAFSYGSPARSGRQASGGTGAGRPRARQGADRAGPAA